MTDPANAARIDWGCCDLPNERGFMMSWTRRLLPSIQSLRISEEVSKATAPVLTIHGTKDRNAPYGAGRDWASMLPNARLHTVEGAAHAPWIEAPDKVLGRKLSGARPSGLPPGFCPVRFCSQIELHKNRRLRIVVVPLARPIAALPIEADRICQIVLRIEVKRRVSRASRVKRTGRRVRCAR